MQQAEPFQIAKMSSMQYLIHILNTTNPKYFYLGCVVKTRTEPGGPEGLYCS